LSIELNDEMEDIKKKIKDLYEAIEKMGLLNIRALDEVWVMDMGHSLTFSDMIEKIHDEIFTKYFWERYSDWESGKILQDVDDLEDDADAFVWKHDPRRVLE
jgi:hypothetical protein